MSFWPYIARCKASVFLIPFLVAVGLPSATAVQPHATEVGLYPVTFTVEWSAPRRAHVRVEATIPASPQRIWLVLTDYDHLAEFVPPLEISQVLKREPDHLILYQKGRIWFPFYRRKAQVVFRVEEFPPKWVRFRMIQGEFVINQGRWSLREVKGGTEIRYEAVVEPDFWIPQWVLYELERQTMKQTFRAVIKRCLSSP